MSYDGPPFAFDPEHPCITLACPAAVARTTGYILDPASIMGEDYHSETLRILKNSGEKEFGGCRTQRMVLAVCDRFRG